VHGQAVPRQPGTGRIAREAVQVRQCLVPAFQESAGGQAGVGQGRTQVEHAAVRHHEAGERGASRSGESADGERAGEKGSAGPR